VIAVGETSAREDSLTGLLAEFDRPEEILSATERAVVAGYVRVDAYTPCHVEGLAETLGLHHTPVPRFVLIGGLVGGITGYCLQWYCAAVDYPVNVGGRPLNSIPSFIPITFELTILFASFAALFGMFYLSGLPRPWRPVFSVDRFRRASRDGFFLWIEAGDPKFHPETTRRFLEGLGARGVYEVAE
jgi:hypothetical protein